MSQVRIITPLLVVITLVGCSSSEQKPAKRETTPKRVTVVSVERWATPAQDELVGTVTARNTASIETKVQARVERIPVTLGSVVRKGDVLAELDARDISARVAQAKAINVQTSQDLKRFESLLTTEAVTQQEFDGIKARAAVAEANLREADALLSYARIVAPFDGRVTRKLIDVGDLATPGKPLFTVEEQAAPRLVVSLPESRLGNLAIGDSVRVTITAVDTTFTGRVGEISPSADPITRGYEAKIELPLSAHIRNGQFARLLLPGAREDNLFVPASAVIRRGQLDLVYVVTVDNFAALRLVRLGRLVGDKYEILSGLEVNERVVTDGQAGLTDGDAVEAES